jgi:hypothetical protein
MHAIARAKKRTFESTERTRCALEGRDFSKGEKERKEREKGKIR